MRVLLLHSCRKMAFACFVCRRLNYNSFIFEGFAYVPKTMLIKVSGIPCSCAVFHETNTIKNGVLFILSIKTVYFSSNCHSCVSLYRWNIYTTS